MIFCYFIFLLASVREIFKIDIQDELLSYELSPRGLRASRYQRAFLAVCLFFEPALLHSDHVVMRQIVDTFFTEDWVVHLHMGLLMNVFDAWDRCKAAAGALQRALNVQIVKRLASSHVSALSTISFPQTAKLSEADLISYATLIAVSNRHLEWIMLHACQFDSFIRQKVQ
ncbi:unnamed protein product [Gongylonema pulchrum]|uniref:Uncharacterized protein n=1 Tax=Gongylonema pulchrum TaxID=637853 RepID=A0A3P7R7F1_9BILA|nr:unnamed protein product [Gongylonema pulchrum]